VLGKGFLSHTSAFALVPQPFAERQMGRHRFYFPLEYSFGPMDSFFKK
jgi:hypothetical protein